MQHRNNESFGNSSFLLKGSLALLECEATAIINIEAMLSLLLFVAVQPQNDAVSRFEKYMRSATTLRVDMGLKGSSEPGVGKGSFLIKRPGHVLFQMKWGASDYVFSCMPDESIALEKGKKLYREYGAVGQLFLPEPDISSTPEYAFPLPLLAGSLRALAPQGTKFETVGKSGSTDLVRAHFATPMADITIEAKIDATGKLLECTRTVHGMPKSDVTTQSFKNYVINKPVADASFAIEIPKEFVPQTLPDDSYPLNVEEKWPIEGWISVDGTASLKSIAQNKVLFIAVGDTTCEVSQRSVSAVDQLAKDVVVKGGAAIAICPTKSSPKPIYKGVPNFYDPSGKILQRLRAPGTPIFFLVSPKGYVTRVWYGFDGALTSEFVKDVLDWVDPKKGG